MSWWQRHHGWPLVAVVGHLLGRRRLGHFPKLFHAPRWARFYVQEDGWVNRSYPWGPDQPRHERYPCRLARLPWLVHHALHTGQWPWRANIKGFPIREENGILRPAATFRTRFWCAQTLPERHERERQIGEWARDMAAQRRAEGRYPFGTKL